MLALPLNFLHYVATKHGYCFEREDGRAMIAPPAAHLLPVKLIISCCIAPCQSASFIVQALQVLLTACKAPAAAEALSVKY